MVPLIWKIVVILSRFFGQEYEHDVSSGYSGAGHGRSLIAGRRSGARRCLRRGYHLGEPACGLDTHAGDCRGHGNDASARHEPRGWSREQDAHQQG